MMQSREKRAVLISETDERIQLLLERKIHTNAYRSTKSFGINGKRSFVRCLHDPRVATADDIATHFRELGSELFHLFVRRRARFQASRTTNRHAIVLARGASKTRQFIDDFPQAGNRAFEQRHRLILVTQLNNIGLSEILS